MTERRLERGDRAVVLGLGVYGRAIARALLTRGIEPIGCDDRPAAESEEFARSEGIELAVAPSPHELRDLLAAADAFLPSPGVPERHVAFELAEQLETPILSEFDLARWWDNRPLAAITGTDGKTTVTLLAVAMLEESGIRAVPVGNTEVPLITAIEDPLVDVFVVEASSFRLAHTRCVRPQVAAWLNFGPDHLDVHLDMASYERAKAKIWADLAPEGLAVAVADDATVLSHLPADRRVARIGGSEGYGRVHQGWLEVDGLQIVELSDLPRSFGHDVTNTLVAAAVALEMGATIDGIRTAIATHRPPPHRIEYIATVDGVDYYDDSKATVPHAVLAAVRSFERVVLVAGGRNKGLDFAPITAESDRIRAVVAMGEAAPEIRDALSGSNRVVMAAGMDDAVARARELAQTGDVVLLSPGCASFDAYENYGARGDDFARAVHELTGAAPERASARTSEPDVAEIEETAR